MLLWRFLYLVGQLENREKPIDNISRYCYIISREKPIDNISRYKGYCSPIFIYLKM